MNNRNHILPILQALLVTFLWSTSFIIIKWGLLEIPPITFAGLRYFIAALCFLPFIIKGKYRSEIKSLTKRQWRKLFLLGLIFYTFTQGAQFIGLSLLPSVTVSLLLNFTPLVVAVLGIFMINEIPTRLQWLGGIVFIGGVFIFFFPVNFEGSQGLGILVMSVGVLANSLAAVIGRDLNRDGKISPIVITFISMSIGAIILLITGLSLDGMPKVSVENAFYIIWLSVINTAFAFTLWNITLRTLSAMESSIINGTMLIQIALLAWYFLDETISMQEGFGMLIAALGALLVQLKFKKKELKDAK